MTIANKKRNKMTIAQVAEEKHKKRVEAEKVNTLKKLAGKKHAERISILERFIIFESTDIPKFFELSGPLALFMYLKASVNRKPKETWANLGKYFSENYLVTARTQSWLATKMKVSQQNLSNWFSKLEGLGFIKAVGIETIEITSPKSKEVFHVEVTVYALGEIVMVEGYPEEVFYYEQ